MQVKGNEFCPCGSGKKYKKCCMDNAPPPEQESVAPTVHPLIAHSAPARFPVSPTLSNYSYDDDDDDDDDDDEYHYPNNGKSGNLVKKNDGNDSVSALLLNSLVGLQTMFLKKKPHIKAYTNLRTLHEEILESMVEYLANGQFIHKSEDAGMMRPKLHDNNIVKLDTYFDCNTDEGQEAWWELNIYKMFPNANCVIEVYLDKNRFRKPEKIALLKSMLISRRSLFLATEVDATLGYVIHKDVFTGMEYQVTDIAMSVNPSAKGMYLYRRIISHEGIHMGVAPVYPYLEDDKFIMSFITRHKKQYNPDNEVVRFCELYNHSLKEESKIKFITYNVNKT